MIGAVIARKRIAGAFGALNRHDLHGFMTAWREDGIFIYPGEIPQSGVFKGKTAVEGWFREFFEQFPGIQFEIQEICVENLFALTGTNTISVHWNIRLTNRSGREGTNSGVTVIKIVGGSVVRVEDFISDLGENFRRNWGAEQY